MVMGLRAMASWLLGDPVAFGAVVMEAVCMYWTGSAHSCCMFWDAVSCMVFMIWVMVGRLSLACSRNMGARCGGGLFLPFA